MKQPINKSKTLAIALLLILGLIGASAYSIKTFTKVGKPTTEDTQPNTPPKTLEAFNTALINNNVAEAVTYLGTEYKKETEEASSPYEGLLQLLKVPVAPNIGVEFEEVSYNKTSAQIEAKLKYSHGYTKRTFYLEQTNNRWEIDKIEVLNTGWTYQDPSMNLQFEYPNNWYLEPGPVEESSWVISNETESSYIIFMALTDVPSQLQELAACDPACAEVTINDTVYEKTTDYNPDTNEAIAILHTTNNGKDYIIIGVTTEMNNKTVEEILNTIRFIY